MSTTNANAQLVFVEKIQESFFQQKITVYL